MLHVLITASSCAMTDRVLQQHNADSIVTHIICLLREYSDMHSSPSLQGQRLHLHNIDWTEWEWAPGTLLVWTHFDVSCNIYVLFLRAGQMESDLEPYLPYPCSAEKICLFPIMLQWGCSNFKVMEMDYSEILEGDCILLKAFGG